jgi:glycosyltransferase involved in cell wall biosynthesis
MKILFVAMSHSIHTARWINQLRGQGWEIHLFPVPYEKRVKVHPELRDLTLQDAFFGRPRGADRSVLAECLCGPRLPRILDRRLLRKHIDRRLPRPDRLARAIDKLHPDLIHALEMLECGYLVAQAGRLTKEPMPPWIVSNWGSELYLLARSSAVWRERALDVLASCDYYMCECKRDVDLAREFGFAGEVLGVIPNAGGLDLAKTARLRQPGPISARRMVALKGYHDWAGRALVAVEALGKCAEWLAGYRVAVYSASDEVAESARAMGRNTGVRVDIVPPVSHDEILRLHGRSRLSIGLSISDAISTSMLEAIAMGSFPIQSKTSCADEWLTCGESGILVEPEDPAGVAAAMTRALTDDALVDRAAEINARVVTERLDESVVRPAAVDVYRKAVSRTYEDS